MRARALNPTHWMGCPHCEAYMLCQRNLFGVEDYLQQSGPQVIVPYMAMLGKLWKSGTIFICF